MISKKEVRRQVTHIVLGSILAISLTIGLFNQLIMIYLTFFIILLSYLTGHGYKVPVFYSFIKSMGRKNESVFPAKGLVFYMIGSTLATMLFTKDIAIASILILAFGDSLSRLIGPRGYIKHPFNNKKFIEGIIAGGAAGAVMAWMYVPLFYSLLASSAAMFLEGLDIEVNGYRIDDNLTIPVVAGAVMFLISLI